MNCQIAKKIALQKITLVVTTKKNVPRIDHFVSVASEGGLSPRNDS